MKHKIKITALAVAAVMTMPQGMAQMATEQPQPVRAVRVEIVKNSDIQQPLDAKRQRRYEIMVLLQAYTIVPDNQKDALKEEIIKRIRADYDENLEHTRQVVEKLEQKLDTLKASLDKENVDERIEQEFERLVNFTKSSSIRLIPIETDKPQTSPQNNNATPGVAPNVNFIPVGMATPAHRQMPQHHNGHRTRMPRHFNIDRTGERPAIRPVRQHHEYLPRTRRVNRDRVNLTPAPRIPEAEMMQAPQPPENPPAPPEEIKAQEQLPQAPSPEVNPGKPQPPVPPEEVKAAKPLPPENLPAPAEPQPPKNPPAPPETPAEPIAAE